MPRNARHLLERHESTSVERFEAMWTGHRTPRHAHPEYQLTLTVSGCGRFEYLAGVARIPVGCLAIFHAGEPHVIGNANRSEPWRLRSLHIPARWVEQAGRPLLQPAPIPAQPDVLPAFMAVWDAFDAAPSRMTKALRTLAGVMAQRPGLEPDRRATSRLVRDGLAHLASVLDRQISMRELAQVVRAEPAQVRRALTVATGLPPQAWHLQRRIQEAKHRLGRGEDITTTALSLGFSDQSHFTRHFTRLVGVSPARYVAGVDGRPATV